MAKFKNLFIVYWTLALVFLLQVMSGKQLLMFTIFIHWVDSSKRQNDAENLTLLNKSFDVIK